MGEAVQAESVSEPLVYKLREQKRATQQRSDLYGTPITAENKKKVRITFRDQVEYEIQPKVLGQAQQSLSLQQNQSSNTKTVVVTMPLCDVFLVESFKEHNKPESNPDDFEEPGEQSHVYQDRASDERPRMSSDRRQRRQQHKTQKATTSKHQQAPLKWKSCRD